MSAPLYFFPTVTLDKLIVGNRLNREILKTYALDEVLGDIDDFNETCSRQDLVNGGPDGHSGAIIRVVTPNQPSTRVGYYPEFQTWTMVQQKPLLYLGVDREYPPLPADLARKRLLPGHDVVLGGQAYQVPVIRSPARPDILPQDMTYDADGTFQMKLKPAYTSLWESTEPVWDFLCGVETEEGENSTMLFEDILTHCLRLLGVNYRIGRHEQTVLRLIDTSTETWNRVFEAACDMPFIRKMTEEEKEAEDSPSEDVSSSEPPEEKPAAETVEEPTQAE